MEFNAGIFSFTGTRSSPLIIFSAASVNRDRVARALAALSALKFIQ
jgi:hypothetical protein